MRFVLVKLQSYSAVDTTLAFHQLCALRAILIIKGDKNTKDTK